MRKLIFFLFFASVSALFAEHIAVQTMPSWPAQANIHAPRAIYFGDGGEKPVTVKPGERLFVILNANKTTGYEWDVLPSNSIDDAFGKGLVSLQNDVYRPLLSSEGVVGSGGYQIYMFKAEEQGSGVLHFFYRRPWERDSKPARTAQLDITVAP